MERLKAMKENLMNSVQAQISGNLDCVDAKELGEAVDMIKDLAEAMVNAYPERNLKLVFDLPKASSNDGTAPFTKGVLDSSKLINLGWSADNDLEEGIKRTIKYLEGV